MKRADLLQDIGTGNTTEHDDIGIQSNIEHLAPRMRPLSLSTTIAHGNNPDDHDEEEHQEEEHEEEGNNEEEAHEEEEDVNEEETQEEGDVVDRMKGDSDEAAKKEEEERKKRIEEEFGEVMKDWRDAIDMVRKMKDELDNNKIDFIRFVNNMGDLSKLVNEEEFERYVQGIVPILNEMTDSNGDKLFKSPNQAIAFVRAMRFQETDKPIPMPQRLEKEVKSETHHQVPSVLLNRSRPIPVNHTWIYRY